MTTKQHNNKFDYLIIGLGLSGLSVVEYLISINANFALIDDREHPPKLDELNQLYKKHGIAQHNIKLQLGSFSSTWQANTLVLSPGLAIADFGDKYGNKEIIGDVELFARINKVPVIAITGSNGKSTLATMLHYAFDKAGIKSVLSGNIGNPILYALKEQETDVIIIELSSFQLETTFSLEPVVALILNITPDHLDRHGSLANYINIKHKIFHKAKNIVVNIDDKNTMPSSNTLNNIADKNIFEITEHKPKAKQWGIVDSNNNASMAMLAYGLLNVAQINDFKLQGKHNIYNILTALAVATALGLPINKIIAGLMSFAGLNHRMQFIKKHNSISYINDSKATNTGATIAALYSLSENSASKNIVLLLGGDSKQASFDDLIPAINKCVRACVLYGKDANIINVALSGNLLDTEIINTANMKNAVVESQKQAKTNDIVLLSPACSSLDQFASFVARGEAFVALIQKLT